MTENRAAKLILALVLLNACHKLPYVPDENAVITLSASPSAIRCGERCRISIEGKKGNGYPLPDGTIVHLSASRGTIPSEAILQGGRVDVDYCSNDDFSGDVEIKARSGQSTIIPESLIITVSDQEVASLMIWADPTELPYGGGESVIDVQAHDERQRPVAGKIVFLSTSQGSLSDGGARTTDANGRIRSILYTEKEAIVTATYKTQVSTTTVRVSSQNVKPVADFTYSPLDPKSGETVYFNAAASHDSDGRIVGYQWDFGDGATGKGETAAHAYTVSSDRKFIVVLKVIDDRGSEGVKSRDIAIQAAD